MASQEEFTIPLPPQPKKQKLSSTKNDSSSQDNEKKSNSRVTRSVRPPRDWSKCFICRNKTYKKDKQLINVSSFEAQDSIKRAAEIKDEDMLHDLLSVNYDQIATEAKYHKNCYTLYTSIKSFKKKESKGESLHEITFQEMVKDIEIGIISGKAYNMASLIDLFKAILKNNDAEAVDSYTKQHLKAHLQKHFADRIVFHQPPERNKPELFYSSNIKIQDVLNAWASHQNAAENEDKEPGEVKKEDIL